jgi:LuxR family maltose regulon positive regulatory protein
VHTPGIALSPSPVSIGYRLKTFSLGREGALVAAAGSAGCLNPPLRWATNVLVVPRTFRFEPPAGRADLLTRPRLLRVLLGRWDHPVATVVGGPGLGKTTLLTQAIAENLLAPRGEDVWVGIEPTDAGGESLAQTVAAALAGSTRPDRSSSPAASTVADGVWRRSPTEVCLVFDDVHLLPASSPGAEWLAELVDALPANGHVLLASRTQPALPLLRLDTQGAVVALGEDALRFTDDELAGFAARRGLDPGRFDETGGWPAMAELAATVNRPLAGSYLWEEVLEPLGPERRRALAVVCDLRGADDQLASAALAEDIELASVLDGVPLVASSGQDGWWVPHPLWQSVPGIALDAKERTELRQRAVDDLVRRDRFDEAFQLVAEAELWDLAPAVLRAACVASDRPTSGQLHRWLSACPPSVRATSAGQLAAAFHATFTAPLDALDPLSSAAEATRADDDPEAEMAALAELGRVAWWRQDLAALAGPAQRVAELARDGHPLAQGLAAMGQAAVADVSGDDAGVMAALDDIAPGSLDPGWTAGARWFRARILLATGEAAEALAILDATDSGADPALRAILDGLRLGTLLALGRLDEVLDRLAAAMTADWAGVEHNRRLGLAAASAILSNLGETEEARRLLDQVTAAASRTPMDQHSVPVALARASLHLAEGDEDEATARLRQAIECHGLEQGIARRSWRDVLATTYILLPEIRHHWDVAIEQGRLRNHFRLARDLAAAVVALRAPGSGWDKQLRALELPDLSVVRGVLHHRLAAELAVGLDAAGRPEGAALLDALGPSGRAAVRAQASEGSGPQAKAARALLAAVPVAPTTPTYVGVLGPLVVRRDGVDGPEVNDPDLRRERVRGLLAYLVGHRRTSREKIMAALWPDLDERSAANNLRVTLNYLLRVLEPDRGAGDPAFLVRVDQQMVELVAGEQLRLDVDLFDQHLAQAARAEADGTPSVALEHDLAAVELYRGDLHADLPEAEWLVLDREHYRTRFVGAAVRVAQLLLGRGDLDEAESHARRALEVDSWAEPAYAVLAAAALGRGDRSAARRRLDHCTEALAELGLEPSDAVHQLRRRLRS